MESIEPKTVSPRQRVDEFPDQCLPVTEKGGSKTFSQRLREELSLIIPKRFSEPRCFKEEQDQRRKACFNITRAEILNLSLPVYRN